MSNVTPLKARPAAAADRYLSPAQVCEMVPGLTVDMLASRRKKRQAPSYMKPTSSEDARGLVVYLESEVRAWIQASRVVCEKP